MTRLKAIKQSLHCDHKNEIWRKTQFAIVLFFGHNVTAHPLTVETSHILSWKGWMIAQKQSTMFWKFYHTAFDDDAVDLKNWVFVQ